MTDHSRSGRARVVNFCTFGMFIIDEIEWTTPNPPIPKYDLIGGAGTYAVLGARIAAGKDLSQTISWIVDVGSDFPSSVKEAIDSWATTCVYRYDLSRKTTRAWNGYGPEEHRAFKYLTTKIRLEVSSLNDEQQSSNCFHMVCSPERCLSIMESLSRARASFATELVSPVVVWEPIPDVCSPSELRNLQRAAQNCTVVSPNHEELRMFFSCGPETTQEVLAKSLMGWDLEDVDYDPPTKRTVLVVREGANGSTAYFPSSHSCKMVSSLHLNAYHAASDSSRVLDPTGGGNTYLGALGLCLTEVTASSPPTKTIHERLIMEQLPLEVVSFVVAMIYATIVASFAIEQNGVPSLQETDTKQENCSEVWNGESFLQRLVAYMSREESHIQKQLDIIAAKLN